MPTGGNPITDVVVTYGESMAPPGYHRVTRDDVGVDLNKLTGGPPTYLWLQEQRGLPYIVDIDIVYGDSEPPEGFEKMGKNLTRGTGSKAFLCFRKQQPVSAGDKSEGGAESESKGDAETGTDSAVDTVLPLSLIHI